MSTHNAAARILVLLALAGGAAPVADAEATGGETTAEMPAHTTLADTLARQGRSQRGPAWMAWTVPVVPGLGHLCCLDRSFQRTACRLEQKNQSWGSRGDDEVSDPGPLMVLVRWANGRAERVRMVSEGCAVDAGTLPLVRVEGVRPADSVALLAALAEGGLEDDGGGPLAALAHHGDPSADAALQRLAATGQPFDLREQALFWTGQARGEEGGRFLAGVARRDPDAEIRKKAVFALSQSSASGAEQAIVEVARRDRDPEVRGEGLFWLAQTDSPRAPEVLLAALDQDPSRQVREKAVFAISQLEGGQAVPLLVRIVRERRDPDLRRQALFWLGQSDDPRAMVFLVGVLAE